MDSLKPLSVDEMILALDRISRFKYPEKKLKRVYIETICSHLISPAFKKSDIEKFDNKSLTKYFTKIWNYSIEKNFGTLENDFSLNKNYIEQEKKCYFINREIMDLMPEKVDFKTLIENIKCVPNNFRNYKTPKKVVLTEGATEEIIMPEFSKIHGSDWNKYGVKIVSTGGKSRILNYYKIYKEQIRVPLFILLDLDAEPVFTQLKKSLRKIDNAHLISAGEIEDIIPVNLFKNDINSEFKLQTKISVNDFDKNISMVENLHNIYKNNGFGEFKKAKVAQLIKETVTKNSTLGEELNIIFDEIEAL
ncbi:ATP-dependent endonuclease [bacterium]|nr:ATP-dependent endonuclease [bacterium]